MFLRKSLLLILSILVTCELSAKVDFKTLKESYNPNTSKGLLYIDKQDLTITLFNSSGDIIVTYPIACGRNIGPKRKKGDYKTPEGLFSLQDIQDASSWGHDFKDGNGYIPHAYGPWFMRLKTGFSGIGIHGTHDPNSIGTRATEGCIRLNNENLALLKPMVTIGMSVIIGPEPGGELPKQNLVDGRKTRKDEIASITKVPTLEEPSKLNVEIKEIHVKPEKINREVDWDIPIYTDKGNSGFPRLRGVIFYLPIRKHY